MLTLAHVCNAQTVLKNIIRETKFDLKGNTESVNGCYLRMDMETRDYAHVRLMTESLRREGFKII